MQYLTSQLISFSHITPPVFPPVLHCYLIFSQSLQFFFFFTFLCLLFCYHLQYLKSVWTAALLHSVNLTDFSVSGVQELKRKGQTWMMFFLTCSGHIIGPKVLRATTFFSSSFCFWCFSLPAWQVTWLNSFWAHCHLLVMMRNTPLFTRRKRFQLIFPLPFY